MRAAVGLPHRSTAQDLTAQPLRAAIGREPKL